MGQPTCTSAFVTQGLLCDDREDRSLYTEVRIGELHLSTITGRKYKKRIGEYKEVNLIARSIAEKDESDAVTSGLRIILSFSKS